MAEEAGRQSRGLHYGWVIAIMSVVTVIGALGLARFGYTMILPSMKDGLGLIDSQAGDLATGNMIGYLVLAVTCGFLASRFGPRIIITIFMLIISGAMLLTGMAPNFQVALLGRTLAGVGSGGTNVRVMGLIPAWFAAKRRGLTTFWRRAWLPPPWVSSPFSSASGRRVAPSSAVASPTSQGPIRLLSSSRVRRPS